MHRKLSRGDKIKQVSISLASAFVNMKVFAKDAELEFLGINQRKAKSVIDTLPSVDCNGMYHALRQMRISINLLKSLLVYNAMYQT